MASPVLQEHLLTPETVNGAIWRYSPRHPKLFHFHGQLEFLLVKRGSLLERIGSRLHRVHAGQLLWHLPGLAHECVAASNEPDLAPPLVELGQLVAGRPVVELRRRDVDALLEHCDTTSEGGEWLEERTPQITSAVWIAYGATRREHDHQRATSLPELACCLMLADPSWDRAEICCALDVSGAYLSRRFRHELGVTLQEQRSRIRVAHFATHVTRERRSSLAAALAAGFGSYSQLHRDFTRLVGMGPRGYFCGGGRNRLALVPA